MATSYELIDYYYVNVKPDEVSRVLQAIDKAGIGLNALHAFPENGQVQLDVSPDDPDAFTALANKEQWKLTGPKKAFLAESDEERTGLLAELYGKLTKEKIPITATSALACEGCFHELFWVPQNQVEKAAKLLNAQPREMEKTVETPAPH